MSIDREGLERERIEIFARNNAQEIYKALQNLKEHRARYRARWLWELIQNARDAHRADQRMSIEITVSAGEIRFRHDGRPFTRKEVLSLIYHGSTKAESEEPLLGKFGTGFLSTHLLSPHVTITGILQQDGQLSTGFQFTLDRSGKTIVAIGEAMEASYQAFKTSAEVGHSATSSWTEYVFATDDGTFDPILLRDLDAQLPAIPYVLAFDARIGSLDVTLPSGQRRFKLIADAPAPSKPWRLLTQEISGPGRDPITMQLLVARSGHAAVAFPFTQTGVVHTLGLLGDTPRLFSYLPLVGTGRIGLPAVFHSAAYKPTEGRDGLVLGEGPETDINKALLTDCAQLLYSVAKECAASDWTNLHQLLRVHVPDEGTAPWIADVQWYQGFQRDILQSLGAIALIPRTVGNAISASDAVIPVAGSILEPDVLFRFALPLFPDSLPDAEVVADMASIAGDWSAIVDSSHPLLTTSILTPSRLLLSVQNSKNLTALANRLKCAVDAAVAWMNDLISAFPEDQRRSSFEGLLPDQTGTFKRYAELSRDDGIDDVLKEALEGLGEPLLSSLLHRQIKQMDSAIPRLETQDQVSTRVKELLKKKADAPNALTDTVFRQTCLSTFKWFAEHERWKDLQDSFPVITLDRDGQDDLQRTSTGSASVIAPRTRWPATSQEYWDAFPSGAILADDYGSFLLEETWDGLARAGIVIDELLIQQEIEVSDEQLERLAIESNLDGEHAPSSKDTGKLFVSKIALLGTERFTDALRKSQERATRFLRFILGYVATVDHSWKQRNEIACQCGKTHTIVPSDWLAWVRHTQWVPRGRHPEYASTESLAFLARRDPTLNALMIQEEIQSLLELLGINVLEQTLLGVEEAQRPVMRRKLAELTKSIRNPSEIDGIIQNLEARRQVKDIWESNQALGKKIEVLVKAVLESLRLEVDVHFRGYDLDAYLENLLVPEEDIGSIEIGATKIEIKATRSDGVSMSGIQAETATLDPAIYWLCVVALDPGDSLAAIDDAYVRARARFVPRIGEILSHPKSELGQAIEVARVSGIDLQHVDAIRYRVNRIVWESTGVNVADFVTIAVSEARSRLPRESTRQGR